MRALVLLSLLSMPSWASETNLHKDVCPNVTEDARLLLNSMQTLLDGLRQEPECQSLADKLAVVNRVVTSGKWKEVKDQLTPGTSVSLEGDDVEALSALANEAAYALTDSIALLSGSSSHCLPAKDKPTFLGTLSGVTREVSGVVGSVTGPYGQAVSLVGSLLSGAISGVDKLFKQNKLYNFQNPSEELLFMNQFCAFTQAQQDISDFLQLETKVEDLRGMEQNYLTNSKIKDLVENCPECNAYKLAWDAKEQSDRIIEDIIADAKIVDVSLNANQRSTFTRCAEIQRAIYSTDSDLNRFVNLLKNYKNPLMSANDQSLITEVTAAVSSLNEIFPPYKDCIKMDNQALSIKFNDFIRDDILALNNTIFAQQMTGFQRQANRRYRDPNGDYIATSLERVKWARREREKISRKINEPNYQMSKQLVIEQRRVLRQRLLSRLMPHYLKHRFRNNQRHIHRFMADFQSFKRNELRFFNGKLETSMTDLTQLTTTLRARPELARYFVSSYDQVFNDSQVIVLEVANNRRYCDYLLYSRSMVPENRVICDKRSEDMKDAMVEFAGFDADLTSILTFDKWAEENLDIQSTYVRDYADRIRAWTERGDSRWEVLD